MNTVTKGGSGRSVVVTGASGGLGRHLCADFSRRGWEVRAMVRDPGSLAGSPGVARVGRCDLPETLEETLLEGSNTLVHCAYATRARSTEQARRVNEEGTRRVLEASRRAGLRRFVFISSLSAHPEAPSYYARSKHSVEGLLDPSRDLIIRPGLILAREGQGLFQRLRGSIQSTRLVPLFGAGRQPLQTVHVDDLCEALARALERGLTGTLSVAEPDPIPMATFLRMMADRLDVRCLFIPVPFGPVLAALRLLETLRLPFPLGSENLLGLKAIRLVPVAEDLQRLDLSVRTAEQSLQDLL